MQWKSVTGWLVSAALAGGLMAACGPQAGRVSPSHRLGLDAWQTLRVEEQGRELRVRVLARRPDDAQGIAARIIRQRRGQGWTTIHVEVRDQETDGLTVTTAHHPYALAAVAAEDLPADQ